MLSGGEQKKDTSPAPRARYRGMLSSPFFFAANTGFHSVYHFATTLTIIGNTLYLIQIHIA